MGRFLGRSVGSLLAALAASNAIAQPVTLNVASGSASITSQTQSSGAWTVLIHVTAGSPAVFTVTTSTSNVVVEKIEVECDADCLMTINQSGGGSFSEVRTVVEAAASSPESFEIDEINIAGNLGSATPLQHVVAAEAIGELHVGGNLTAEVIAGPRASSADSDIQAITVGGTLSGDVYAEYGAIGTIDVTGDIGLPGVQTSYIWADHGIESIDADEGFAWVKATLGTSFSYINHIHFRDDFAGTIWSSGIQDSQTVLNPGATFEGSCEGDLLLGQIEVPVVIAGDMDGDLWLNGVQPGVTVDILGDLLNSSLITFNYGIGGTLRIAGDLAANSLIWHGPSTIDFDGNPGYLILNAADAGTGWLGEVRVNQTTLGPVPHYDEEDLLGAVGLVPFALHDGDCIPENGNIVSVQDPLTVELAFYGPVKASNTSLPVDVAYRDFIGGVWTSWTSDNANWDVLSGLGTRFVTLIYDDDPTALPSGREYRVTSTSDEGRTLLCDRLLAEADVRVDDFEYVFEIP